MSARTPCRLMVFSTRLIRRGKRIVEVGVGWQDWNDDRQMERKMARLPGAGSFYYPTHRAAYRRACVLVRRGAHQVKVETISGREIGRVYA